MFSYSTTFLDLAYGQDVLFVPTYRGLVDSVFLISPNLPDGLAFDMTTGIISGTVVPVDYQGELSIYPEQRRALVFPLTIRVSPRKYYECCMRVPYLHIRSSG